MNCPYCGEHCCDPEYVDVGVGRGVQVTPHQCEKEGCYAIEIGGYWHNGLTKVEKKTGWFRPENWCDFDDLFQSIHQSGDEIAADSFKIY
jgi:hypothetical protein